MTALGFRSLVLVIIIIILKFGCCGCDSLALDEVFLFSHAADHSIAISLHQ